jgi:hypothetical protein
MRDIEVLLANLQSGKDVTIFAPLINWSWHNAGRHFTGEISGQISKPEYYEAFKSDPWWPLLKTDFDRNTWIYPHVYLPHALTIVTGFVLFLLGVFGAIKMPL